MYIQTILHCLTEHFGRDLGLAESGMLYRQSVNGGPARALVRQDRKRERKKKIVKIALLTCHIEQRSENPPQSSKWRPGERYHELQLRCSAPDWDWRFWVGILRGGAINCLFVILREKHYPSNNTTLDLRFDSLFRYKCPFAWTGIN